MRHDEQDEESSDEMRTPLVTTTFRDGHFSLRATITLLFPTVLSYVIMIPINDLYLPFMCVLKVPEYPI